MRNSTFSCCVPFRFSMTFQLLYLLFNIIFLFLNSFFGCNFFWNLFIVFLFLSLADVPHSALPGVRFLCAVLKTPLNLKFVSSVSNVSQLFYQLYLLVFFEGLCDDKYCDCVVAECDNIEIIMHIHWALWTLRRKKRSKIWNANNNSKHKECIFRRQRKRNHREEEKFKMKGTLDAQPP